MVIYTSQPTKLVEVWDSKEKRGETKPIDYHKKIAWSNRFLPTCPFIGEFIYILLVNKKCKNYIEKLMKNAVKMGIKKLM